MFYNKRGYRDDRTERACAERSRIPECCIAFYLSTWNTWWNNGYMEKIHDYNNQCHRYFWTHQLQYVPCPDCLKNKQFNRLYECGQIDYDVCNIGNCNQTRRKLKESHENI